MDAHCALCSAHALRWGNTGMHCAMHTAQSTHCPVCNKKCPVYTLQYPSLHCIGLWMCTLTERWGHTSSGEAAVTREASEHHLHRSPIVLWSTANLLDSQKLHNFKLANAMDYQKWSIWKQTQTGDITTGTWTVFRGPDAGLKGILHQTNFYRLNLI